MRFYLSFDLDFDLLIVSGKAGTCIGKNEIVLGIDFYE